MRKDTTLLQIRKVGNEKITTLHQGSQGIPLQGEGDLVVRKIVRVKGVSTSIQVEVFRRVLHLDLRKSLSLS